MKREISWQAVMYGSDPVKLRQGVTLGVVVLPRRVSHSQLSVRQL
jgi:hypothetical protein